MSTTSPSLKNFIEPVPLCLQTAALESLRSIFSSSNCDRVAVVNEQLQPLGLVYLRSLWALWSRSHKRRAATFVRKPDRDRTSQGITRGSERQRILAVPANRGTEHPSPGKPPNRRQLLKQPDRPDRCQR